MCVLKGSPPTFFMFLPVSCTPVFSCTDLNRSHFCNRFANFSYWSSTVLYVCKCMHILNDFFFPACFCPWEVGARTMKGIWMWSYALLLYWMWVFFYLFYIALLLIFFSMAIISVSYRICVFLFYFLEICCICIGNHFCFFFCLFFSFFFLFSLKKHTNF